MIETGSAGSTRASVSEMTEMRGLSIKRRKARSSSRRCGSTSKTARSANLRSRVSIRAPPKGPVTLERFALKSLDISGLMRMRRQFSNPAQKPSPDQAAGMLLPLIEGVEVKGSSRPTRTPARPINIENFNLNWGQFVGPIPSTVAAVGEDVDSVRYQATVGQKMLVAAGLDRAAIDSRSRRGLDRDLRHIGAGARGSSNSAAC